MGELAVKEPLVIRETGARGRGRATGFRMSEAHRVKIQNSNILNALIEHIEGHREMTPTQVSAALGLLRKVLPDLANVQITGEGGGPIQLIVTPVDVSL